MYGVNSMSLRSPRLSPSVKLSSLAAMASIVVSSWMAWQQLLSLFLSSPCSWGSLSPCSWNSVSLCCWGSISPHSWGSVLMEDCWGMYSNIWDCLRTKGDYSCLTKNANGKVWLDWVPQMTEKTRKIMLCDYLSLSLSEVSYNVLPWVLHRSKGPYIKWLKNVCTMRWELQKMDTILTTITLTPYVMCDSWPSRIKRTARSSGRRGINIGWTRKGSPCIHLLGVHEYRAPSGPPLVLEDIIHSLVYTMHGGRNWPAADAPVCTVTFSLPEPPRSACVDLSPPQMMIMLGVQLRGNRDSSTLKIHSGSCFRFSFVKVGARHCWNQWSRTTRHVAFARTICSCCGLGWTSIWSCCSLEWTSLEWRFMNPAHHASFFRCIIFEWVGTLICKQNNYLHFSVIYPKTPLCKQLTSFLYVYFLCSCENSWMSYSSIHGYLPQYSIF